MRSVEEPSQRKVRFLVEALEREMDGAEALDEEIFARINSTITDYAVHYRQPVLLVRLLRALEVPEATIYDAAVSLCADDEDRAYLAVELFLSGQVQAFIEDGE